MAQFDYGGGCPCGLRRVCDCKDATTLRDPEPDDISRKHASELRLAVLAERARCYTNIEIRDARMRAARDREVAEAVLQAAACHVGVTETLPGGWFHDRDWFARRVADNLRAIDLDAVIASVDKGDNS